MAMVEGFWMRALQGRNAAMGRAKGMMRCRRSMEGASPAAMCVLAAILLTFPAGCTVAVHSEPARNQPFHPVSRLCEFAGVYRNAGEPEGRLSEIIWGDTGPDAVPEAGHEDIAFLEVSSTGNSLVVKAIGNGCVVQEKTFVLGRDFKISDGRIVIHRDVSLLSRGGDDVLLGPSREQATLGLDTEKHGKYRYAASAAGLVFMVIPAAMSEVRDVRFERVSERPPGFQACGGR